MSSATTFEDIKNLFHQTSLQFKETERILREQNAELNRKFTETDRKFAETAERFKETERLVKDVSKQIGNLGGKWGEFVENMVAPACETLFSERGIPVHRAAKNVKCKQDKGDSMEIDILVENGDAVVLVEAKSTLEEEDIHHHLKRLAQFKTFFPRYGDCRVFGAVAGVVIKEQVENFASNQGLFVIVQSGENMTIANEPDFKPRSW